MTLAFKMNKHAKYLDQSSVRTKVILRTITHRHTHTPVRSFYLATKMAGNKPAREIKKPDIP